MHNTQTMKQHINVGFSSSKKIEEHIVRVMKQHINAMKFAQLKKIDEGTVNIRQAATTMKFVTQFK